MKPWYDQGGVTVYCADAREALAALPDGRAWCAVTSPPYWGLRDYGVAGQIGMEATVEEYVASLVTVFREVRRVLRPEGTLWLNIGDSYYAPQTNGGIGATSLMGSRRSPEVFRAAQRAHRTGTAPKKGQEPADVLDAPHRRVQAGVKRKDLVGVPWTLAFALRADGWYLRQDIIWHKPNPMPESVTDRPTKAHEYVFLLSKSERYWYDASAIAEPARAAEANAPERIASPHGQGFTRRARTGKNEATPDRRRAGFNERWDANEGTGGGG